MVAYFVAEQAQYTAQLQAGLGLIAETKLLLQLWTSGMSVSELYRSALASGEFPNISARRLRNIVVEGFATRYLKDEATPARHLKILLPTLTSEEIQQFFLLFTCRAQPILGDFIRQVYWARYAAGDRTLTNELARQFIERAIDRGKIAKPWAEVTIRRIAGNLTGCCADYGLLEGGIRRKRQFLPVRLLDKVIVYLAYDLHRQGISDQALLHHVDWQLFGLDAIDVLAELKRLALDQWFIVQSGGQVVRISWKYSEMEALCYVLAH